MRQTDSIWAKVELKSAPEEFYGLFKDHVEDLVHMFPEQYESIQVVEEEKFSAAKVIVFKYHFGSQVVTEKYSLRVVNDHGRKYVIYEAVEGDVLKHYKVFRVKIEVVDGSGLSKVGRNFAKWTIEFGNADKYLPSPEKHMEFFLNISKGVDAYFSKN